MAPAEQGDTVKVHYTGKLEDGRVFDSSKDREPLQFTVGEGQVLPGFEQAIVGMQPGEQKSETIPAEKAFGERRDELVVKVNREEFKTDQELEVGQRFSVKGEGGAQTFTIVELDESSATIDANHELAGLDLVFDIELVAIV
jgi:peptidylprolyl isomerase